jgi:hypothetical protein
MTDQKTASASDKESNASDISTRKTRPGRLFAEENVTTQTHKGV